MCESAGRQLLDRLRLGRAPKPERPLDVSLWRTTHVECSQGHPCALSGERVTEVCVESKRASKSFRYRAKTTWSSARLCLLSAAEKPDIIVGSPPEFKGERSIWAPEELLVGSVNTCMMLTFLSLAQSAGPDPGRI